MSYPLYKKVNVAIKVHFISFFNSQHENNNCDITKKLSKQKRQKHTPEKKGT